MVKMPKWLKKQPLDPEEQVKRENLEAYEHLKGLPGVQILKSGDTSTEICTESINFPSIDTATIQHKSVHLEAQGIELHLAPVLRENIKQAKMLFDFLEKLSMVTRTLEDQCDVLMDQLLEAGEIEDGAIKKTRKQRELEFDEDAIDLVNKLRNQTLDLIRETSHHQNSGVDLDIMDEYLDEIIGISDELQSALKNPKEFMEYFTQILSNTVTGQESMSNLRRQFNILISEFGKVDRPVRELQYLLKLFDQSLHKFSRSDDESAA